MYRALVLVFFVLLLVGCDGREYADGHLNISYELNDVAKITPSLQTVIWLEDGEGNYVRSFLVSEYLSLGGYNRKEICPDWSSKAEWNDVTDVEADAVTQATPRTGQNVVEIDCGLEKIKPGNYNYCVQTHLVDKYNILYRGMISIGGEKTESVAERTYTPEKHIDGEDVLANVKAEFVP